jgi:aspartate aminotransferase
MYKEDTFPTKVNLGIGAYRTAEGKTWILPSVKAAEEAVCSDSCADKEYQPIDGKPEYKRPVQELIFSPEMIDSGTVVSVQALSGTGSLTIITQFMVNWLGAKKIYIPDPTWGNHPAIFKRAGLSEVEKYPYWDAATKGLAFDGMMATLKAAKPGEVVLLHAVAHNPTGVDPSEDQWKQIVEVCKTNKLIPLLDNAYQGYASGNLARDGLAQDLFAASGLEYFIAQSFAKKLRPVRRAHRVHPCQSCGQGNCASSAVPNEDPRPTMLLQSAAPWRCHCQQDLVHSKIEESMA